MATRTEPKTCPDCGVRYFNDGWHMENCTGPPVRQVIVCGRRYHQPGWGHQTCFQVAGHRGPCGTRY